MGFEVILCGDFDVITEENDRIPIKDIPLSRDGKLLEKVSDTCKMVDAFREIYPNKPGYTQIDSCVKTTIDRVCV